jgi:hypothetical protein
MLNFILFFMHKILDYNQETFEKDLLEEINQVRKYPENYVNKLDNIISLISPLTKDEINLSKECTSVNNLNSYFSDSWKKSGKFKIKIENICNIVLKKGKEQFISTIDILKNFEGMEELTWQDDLCLPIPNNMNEWTKRENISVLLKELEFTGKYSQIAFHYEIGIKNSIVSTILQVVDDSPFRGSRRNNIMNSNFNYIGITSKEHEGQICSFFTFASKAN